MNKLFCDMCDTEMNTNRTRSSYGYIKMKMAGGGSNGMTPVNVVEDYCPGCTDEVIEKIEELKQNKRKSLVNSKK